MTRDELLELVAAVQKHLIERGQAAGEVAL
jgi:hypothetical protein